MLRQYLILGALCLASVSSRASEGNWDYLDKVKNGSVYTAVGGRCGIQVEVVKDRGLVYTSWKNVNGFCFAKGTWEFVCSPTENRCIETFFPTFKYVLSVLPTGNLLLETNSRRVVFELKTKNRTCEENEIIP